MQFRALIYCFCLIAMSAARADNGLEDVSIYLKWFHQYQFAGIYVAKEKGFYEEAGFNVEIIERDTSQDPYEVVLSGKATFGISESDIVLHRLNNDPVVVLATVFQHSPLIFMVLEDSGILSPYDLVGKRTTYAKDSSDASLLAMFTVLGIDTAELIHQEFNFDDYALAKGETDAMAAYITDQPYLYEQMGLPVRIIDPASYGIDFYGDLLFTREDYVRQNPERAEAFAKATLKGWEYALHNPEEVIDWLLSKYGTKKTRGELEYEVKATNAIINTRHIELGTINANRFTRIANIYKSLGLAPENGSMEGLTLIEYTDPLDDQTQFMLRMTVFVAAIGASIIFTLWAVNFRLRKTVEQRTAELTTANRILAQQLELIDKNVFITRVGIDGRLQSVSTAFCEAVGYDISELIGHYESEFHHPDFKVEDPTKMTEAFQQGHPWSGEFMLKTRFGDRLWVSATLTPKIDAKSSEIICIEGISTDITSTKLLEKQSRTDPLTGLANRLAIDEAIQHKWEYYQRFHTPFSIIIFDLDMFKHVNDEYGHIEGDRVLIDLCRIAGKQLREVDTLGRWGGEEFIVICPNTNHQEAMIVAEKLRLTIATAHILTSQRVTASFGVSGTDDQIKEKGTLFKLADEALYMAKANGRNKVCIVEEVYRQQE